MPNLNLSRAEQVLLGALAITVTAIIVLFIALSFFNVPAADDFCFAAKARELGFLDAQVYWYQHWAGRYTLNAVWTALMAGDIFQIYRFPPIALLLGTGLGFAFLTARIAQGALSIPLALLLGGLWTVLFIAGAPDIAQTFYWLGGSITYQLANVTLLFLLGLLIWRETTARTRPLQIVIFWVAAWLVIVTIGANEISMLLVLAILSGGLSHALWRRRNSRVFWLALTLIAVLATASSVLAPGNYQRYVGLGHTDHMLRPTPWLAALLYLPWVALRLFYWLSNLGLWASALLVFSLSAQPVRALLYDAEGRFRRSFLLLPVLWMALIFLLSAIGFLINRYPLPERAESVIYLLFLLGGYPTFIILAHRWAGAAGGLADRRWRAPAAALLLVSLLGTPNVFEGYKDVYRGYRYAQEMQARNAAIAVALQRGEQDIAVASLSRPPRTLFATDIATDPDDFKNLCLQQYYRVHSIRLGEVRPQQP